MMKKESTRTIKSAHGNFHAVINYDNEWKEYRVGFYRNDKLIGDNCTYFTDSFQDAVSTAEVELRQMEKKFFV